jgi:hypothetical protein
MNCNKIIVNIISRLQAAWVALFYERYSVVYTDNRRGGLKIKSFSKGLHTESDLEKYRISYFDGVRENIYLITERSGGGLGITQIATTISQSRKLIELGVPIETADMCYKATDIDDPTLNTYKLSLGGSLKTTDVPAWSLDALFHLFQSISLTRLCDTWDCLAPTLLKDKYITAANSPFDAICATIMEYLKPGSASKAGYHLNDIKEDKQ